MHHGKGGWFLKKLWYWVGGGVEMNAWFINRVDTLFIKPDTFVIVIHKIVKSNISELTFA